MSAVLRNIAESLDDSSSDSESNVIAPRAHEPLVAALPIRARKPKAKSKARKAAKAKASAGLGALRAYLPAHSNDAALSDVPLNLVVKRVALRIADPHAAVPAVQVVGCHGNNCVSTQLCARCASAHALFAAEAQRHKPRSLVGQLRLADALLDSDERAQWADARSEAAAQRERRQAEHSAANAAADDDARDDGGAAGDAAAERAAAGEHSAPGESRGDFFQLRREDEATLELSLSEACGAVVDALLIGNKKQLQKWASKHVSTDVETRRTRFQRKMASDAAAGGEPVGFDERFNLMLMDLLQSVRGDEARRVLELHAQFENESSLTGTCNLAHEPILIGGLASARDLAQLEQAKVGAIVALGGYTRFFGDRFAYHECVVRDRSKERIVPSIESTVQFVREQMAQKPGQRILIHCFGGRSRSTTVVAGVLMSLFDMSLHDALAAVVRARPIVSPNCGFLRQLRGFEEKLKR